MEWTMENTSKSIFPCQYPALLLYTYLLTNLLIASSVLLQAFIRASS